MQTVRWIEVPPVVALNAFTGAGYACALSRALVALELLPASLISRTSHLSGHTIYGLGADRTQSRKGAEICLGD